jgi:hypothetical protein
MTMKQRELLEEAHFRLRALTRCVARLQRAHQSAIPTKHCLSLRNALVYCCAEEADDDFCGWRLTRKLPYPCGLPWPR